MIEINKRTFCRHARDFIDLRKSRCQITRHSRQKAFKNKGLLNLLGRNWRAFAALMRGGIIMILQRSIICAATGLAIALSSTAAMAQDVGDWVLSPWRGSSVFYPGVVESRSGSVITVRFDDGDVETRQADTVVPFDWQAGSRIACAWSDGKWYKATIRSIAADGYTMQIRYDDDGTVEDTNTGRCRTR